MKKIGCKQLSSMAKDQVIVKEGNKASFYSYGVKVAQVDDRGPILLDSTYWNYSRTTSKYLGRFLGESGDEIKKNVASGRYSLVNLNE